MRIPGFIVASCLTMTLPVIADFDKAVEEPPEVLRSYAQNGDPASQYNLAIRLQNGSDGAPEPAAAVTWYQKAAEAGFPEAQNNLAVALMKGDGVPKDEKLAAKWFHAAASQGLFEAQKTMIECYATGRGVELNSEKALRWDFIARRTLELRFRKPAGEPHRPVPLSADQLNPIGREATFEPDGTLKRYEDGRHVERDRNGTIVTTWPDGKRTVEGDGVTSRGEKTRALTTYDKDGNQVSQRFRSGREIVETLQDGSQLIERTGHDDAGRKVQLFQRIEKSGAPGPHRLVREDGAERQGKELWTVTYWRNGPGSQIQQVRAKFGQGRSSYGEEILKTESPTLEKESGGSLTVTSEKVNPPVTIAQVIETRTIGEELYRPDTDVKAQLHELEDLERDSGYFPGVTDTQFEQARTSSQQYVFKLPIAPQKASPQTQVSKRLDVQAAPPPTPGLIRILDDLSSRYPVGLYGRAILTRYAWKHAETPNFVIHYINHTDAEPVFRHIESAFFLVAQTLQIDLSRFRGRKSHVFIFPSQAAWDAFKTAQGFPATIAGFAYKEELLFGALSDESAYVKLLSHEATHAIVDRFYPGRSWPLWLNEGFAEYIATKAPPVQRALASGQFAQGGRKLEGIDLQKLFDRIRYGGSQFGLTWVRAKELQNFYGESERCVRTLLEKLPGDAFPAFANLMMAGNPPDVALKEAYGDACPDTKALQALVSAVR